MSISGKSTASPVFCWWMTTRISAAASGANMEDSGVDFDEVYSGEEAIALVKKEYGAGHEYSTIILDWQMPGMNGLDTAREIRRSFPLTRRFCS